MEKPNVVITINALSKRYGSSKIYAVHNLSINVFKGDVYGFIGPNGAGKSTTIRTLLHFIQPTEGSARVLGLDVVKQSTEVKKHVGYLAGDFTAYEKMSGSQFLRYMQSLQLQKSSTYTKKLIQRFNVNTHKKISDLSKGNKQKLGIVQAFMHQPDVLILDEPTDGLDPLMQAEFYALAEEHAKAGATIFLSSHNLNEVRKICNRVGVIKDGKLVKEGSVTDLVFEASQTFEVVFEKRAPLNALKKLPRVSEIEDMGNNTVRFHVHGDLQSLFKFLARYAIRSLKTQEADLEKVFTKYYKTGSNR